MVALPAAQSDAVVRGEVIDAQAYLSNDKTGIYSEFTVRIGEVLKDFQQAPIADDQQITVEREGGAVKFSSGRIQRYSIANQRMPRVGRQYVLFLKYNEEGKDYSILTGYEIRRGRVIPLDALAQFAAYKNSEEVSFLNAVKDAIARPAQTSKGGEY
ncbi:MAG TPA: hypothetical protein VNO70_15720 [Blastocatellia bacterium]|nr:hypothetical protein [Blastocatellia bacterium]